MAISSLKYPPIKHVQFKNVPEKLIYHSYTGFFSCKIDKFTMFSTKKTELNNRCMMICFPESIFREGKLVKSLYVQNLISNCSGSGFGTAMLDFAKKYSEKVGCKGRFHLFASSSYTPKRSPHVFYKRYGLNSGDFLVDKKLDRFIKKGKNSTYLDFKDMEMYYPPIKGKSLFRRFIDNLFKKDIEEF